MGTEHAAPAGPLPLDFERWADLSARLLSLLPDERLDLLDQQGVDPGDMERCDVHYALELAQELGQGRRERAETYGRKCADELARRKQEPAAPEPVEEVEVEPEPEPKVTPEPEPSGAPTFLREPPAPASPSLRVGAATMGTFELPTAFKNGALPFKPGSSALFTAPSEPPQARSAPPVPRDAGLAATMDFGTDLSALLPATPFVPQSAPAPAPFPRMPLETYASLCAELAVFPQKAWPPRRRCASPRPPPSVLTCTRMASTDPQNLATSGRSRAEPVPCHGAVVALLCRR